MYAFLPLKKILTQLPEIQAQGVSVRARSPGQFLEIYKQFGTRLPAEWITKRNNFIKRTLAAYIKNPTRRRELSLRVWAMDLFAHDT